MSKIPYGTLVYPTKLSIDRSVNKPSDLGTFLGYQNNGNNLWVVKFQKHIAYTYHPNFWTTDPRGWKG